MKAGRRLAPLLIAGAAVLGVLALIAGNYVTAVVMVFVIAGQLLVLSRIRRDPDN
jgi:hypothetical protein